MALSEEVSADYVINPAACIPSFNLAKGIFIPKAKLKAKGTKARISYRVFNYKVAQLQYKHHTNEINKPDVLRGKRYSLAQNIRSRGNDFRALIYRHWWHANVLVVRRHAQK